MGGAHGCLCYRRTAYSAALKRSSGPGQRYERRVSWSSRYIYMMRVAFRSGANPAYGLEHMVHPRIVRPHFYPIDYPLAAVSPRM